MQNIEIKTRVSEFAGIRRRLHAMGAVRRWTRRQHDRFYRANDGLLKLRTCEGGRSELIAYTRSTESAAARPSDYDIASVVDADALERVLSRALGRAGSVEKTRELWTWRATRIHLDRVRGLGDFLELETVVGNRTLGEAHTETAAVIKTLRLNESGFIAVPYRDLLANGSELRRETDAS